MLELDIHAHTHLTALYDSVGIVELPLYNRSLNALESAVQQHMSPCAFRFTLNAHALTQYPCVCVMQIRSKALVQYTTPFISVNLPTMAEAFRTDVR